MSKFLKRINNAPVTAELLGKVLTMVAGMTPEDRPVMEARIVRVFDLIDNKGLVDDRNHFAKSMLATALEFCLTALAELQQKSDRLNAWTMPGEERGCILLNGDVVEAAAQEPLLEDGEGNLYFDLQSFQRRILKITETSESG